MIPRVRGTLAAALLVLLALVPRPSDAQVGKLLKKAKDKAADAATKAVDAVGTDKDKAKTAAAAKAGAPASASAPTPASHPALDVTGDNLDMFIAVMKSDVARYAPRLAWAKKVKARAACQDSVMKDPAAMMKGGERNRVEEKKAQARLDALSASMQAAAQAQQADRLEAIVDSMRVAQEVQNYWQIPGLRRCGLPSDPPPGATGKLAGPAPALPDDITPNQYGLLRERIAAWLLSHGKVGAPLLKAEETALLAQRVGELTPFTDYFRNGVIEWLEWQDVEQWKP